jgi:hypothetical protein
MIKCKDCKWWRDNHINANQSTNNDCTIKIVNLDIKENSECLYRDQNMIVSANFGCIHGEKRDD